MKLSIVLCVHNQRHTILATLDRLWSSAPPGCQLELVIVDNHSTDGTQETLRTQTATDLLIIYESRPRPTVTCWRSAVAHLSGDYVLLGWSKHVQTGKKALAAVTAGAGDGINAVYASPSDRPRRDLVTRLTNLLFGSDLDDVLGADKLVSADLLRRINLRGEGVAFDVTLTARLLKAGVPIRQIPGTGGDAGARVRGLAHLRAIQALAGALLDPSPVWKPGQRPAYVA